MLGGEGSGHLIALDLRTTGDGIVSALRVRQVVLSGGRPLAQLLDGVMPFPRTLVNVRLTSASEWNNNARLAAEHERVAAELHGHGRVLIRASGKEPLLRVMVKARDGVVARRCAERLAEVAHIG